MALSVVYPLKGSTAASTIDVVAVHGLGGDAINTWTHPESKAFWLKDFLPQQIPDARILTFGYNAAAAFSDSTAEVVDYAKSLLASLVDKREEAEERDRPLIFIAHSLGGIVVKQALLQARLEPRYQPIRDATLGIIFFSTPHRGSNKAVYGKVLANVAQTMTHQPPARLMSALQTNSDVLLRLTSDFRFQLPQYQVVSFYEQRPMKVFSNLIVEKQSALLEVEHEEQIPVDANHSAMCKFATVEDDTFEKVYKRIRRMRKQSPPLAGVQAGQTPRKTTSGRLNHDDYTIAWVAVLPIEAEAALGMLDKKHDGYFETGRGDDYIYIGGEINRHNVVIATWPAGQNYGVGAAAALVNQVKSRFSNMWFALLVGVAAGLPNLTSDDLHRRRDIRLGDVLVCVPDKAGSGIVHYDLGRDTKEGFLLNGRQAETPSIVRAAIGHIRLTKKKPYKQGNEFAQILASFQESHEDNIFTCLGQESDQLYAYHTDPTMAPEPIRREQRDESERTRVWYGSIGSGNSLMRNPRRRDELRDMHGLIGLEMEAAGVMNTIPTGVIRGVCDYGDDSKNKEWQPYAAVVAAVYAKGILCCIHPKALLKQSG